MFEKERAEIRVLSNIADAQGLGRARDLLRLAENEFSERSKHYEEISSAALSPVEDGELDQDDRIIDNSSEPT